MEETFAININCSKIVPCGHAGHYTMFIDSSKMSIVYELVEWIRWMFSVKECIYLTHENSVIHELEDIQMLYKLENFEILPCGQPQCVHKKIYRSLLNNLNLIVPWNDTKVHKYFLEKINQMNQKISIENSKKNILGSNNKISQNFSSNSEIVNSKTVNMVENDFYSGKNEVVESSLANDSVTLKTNKVIGSYKSTANGESQYEVIMSKDKGPEEMQFFFQPEQNNSFCETSLNKCSEMKEINSPVSHSTSSIYSFGKKKNSGSNDTFSSNNPKAKVNEKYIRPFSLGKMLSNLREDYEKKKNELSGMSENNSEGGNGPCDKNLNDEFLLQMQEHTSQKKKKVRHRSRKRFKGLKLGTAGPSYASENSKPHFALNTSKADFNIKPNHIRFEVDMDDQLINLEKTGEQNRNELDVPMEDVNNTNASEVLKNESENLIQVVNISQNLAQGTEMNYLEKNVTNELECLPPNIIQTKANDQLSNTVNEPSDNVTQLLGSSNNCESVDFNYDLNNLLSQREKFMKGIVIQRFY